MAFNSNPGKQAFTATAAQTDFDFNFKIYDGETDIKVYQTPVGQVANDDDDILVFGTEYTVSINGDLGGTVTLLTGATLNDTIVINRDLPVTREISYVTQGDLLADTINIDQNYQTYLIVDGFVALAAALKLPDTAVGVSTQLPQAVSDAYLKWNAAADAIENDTTIPDAVTEAADSAAAALVSEINAAISAANAALSAASIGHAITDTIATLRAMTSAPLTIYVTGYHVAGDGAFGSNVFKWNSTSTEADNGGTIIKLATITTGRYELQYSGAINVKWFGLIPNDITQDLNTKLYELTLLGFENFEIDDTFYAAGATTRNIDGNFKLKGTSPSSKIITNGRTYINFNVNPALETTATQTIDMYSKDITLSDVTGIEIGDVISIVSNIVGETNWNTLKQDSGNVYGISGNTVTLSFTTNFNYNIATETITVKTFKPRTFEVSDIEFDFTDDVNDPTPSTGCLLFGGNFNKSLYRNLTAYGHRDQSWFIRPTLCVNVNVENITCHDLLYPVVFHGGRNLTVSNLACTNTSSTVNTTNFATDVFCDNVFAHDLTTIFAFHTGFDVHISNCVSQRDKGMQFRTCGGSISNVTINYDDTMTDDGSGNWQNTLFTNVSENPYLKHSFSIDALKLIPSSGGYTSSVSFNEDQDVNVTNSQLGSVAIPLNGLCQLRLSNTNLSSLNFRGRYCNISNCKFEATSTTIASALSLDGCGDGNYDNPIMISNTKFIGYTSIQGLNSTNRLQRFFWSNCYFREITQFYAAANVDSTYLTYHVSHCYFYDVALFSNHTDQFRGLYFSDCEGYGTTPTLPV